MIETLRAFKSSANLRERMVFRCMIHNLFDEYKFFNNYPDKVRGRARIELYVPAYRTRLTTRLRAVVSQHLSSARPLVLHSIHVAD